MAENIVGCMRRIGMEAAFLRARYGTTEEFPTRVVFPYPQLALAMEPRFSGHDNFNMEDPHDGVIAEEGSIRTIDEKYPDGTSTSATKRRLKGMH
ncbi:hypothetical protein HAX54_037440 [Datura stramonium]|uniref:Uncharacterized protein n=1 Tax=Datura stramonium TaxID=4076 RepID=A0ABS8VJ22_DATST|nr:hypothetical protein [Datura stramonium]